MELLSGQWTFYGAMGGETRVRLPFADVANEGDTVFCDENVGLLVRGPAVVKLRRHSSKPGGETDSVLVWKGRLDNAPALAGALGIAPNVPGERAEIVGQAYERWGSEAFGRVQGDWALAIWDARERCLILARDPIGTQPLFYSLTPAGLKWSSSLAWLVQNSGRSLSLNLEYLAGWLSFFPSATITPYSGIAAVPPSCFVKFQDRRAVTCKYWDFQPIESAGVRDAYEYEEQFRSLLSNSIRRRLRSSRPVLAELSGGMDSSSIVCIADALLLREPGLTPRLDTLSYYDDDEPNWNERPYFTLVERKRGREGLHIAVDSSRYAAGLFENQEFAVVPAELGKTSGRDDQVTEFIRSHGYGTILSGIGGDEFTGGVPTPIPELADLLASGQIRVFARQLMQWALSQKRPWTVLCFETLRSFAPPYFGRLASARKPPLWLTARFRRQFRSVLTGYDKPLTLWGHRPTFQENLSALEALRRQLAMSHVGSDNPAQKCYPYLDCDLLQFLFNVPREQLVQPGRRRALMRRSLCGIVPDEILNRKRKAYVSRAPRTAIAGQWPNMQAVTRDMIAESLGIVSSAAFRQALEDVRSGKEGAIVPIQRMLLLECWLRNLSQCGVLSSTGSVPRHKYQHRASSAPV